LFKPSQSSRPDAVEHADDHETTPFPPRFYWLKRLTAAYLFFVTCLAVLYWGWTAYSHRKLAAAIAEIKGRGEPALLADFIPPETVPDDRNGAIPLQAAADVIANRQKNVVDDPADSRLRDDPWLLVAADADQRRPVAKHITDRAEALRLVRAARPLDAADWGTRIRKNWIQARLPHLSGQRDLARFLVFAAAYRHATGDDAQAVEICRDILHQSDLLAQDTPVAVTISASRGLAIEGAMALDRLAPTLKLPREHVRQVTDELLDDRLARDRFAAWPRFERAATIDTFKSYIEAHRVWPVPMFRLDTVRSVRRWDALVAAAPSFTYADFGPTTRPLLNEWDDLPRRDHDLWQKFARPYPPRLVRITQLLSQIPVPHTPAVQSEALARLGRRVVAIRLAARAYQLDYGRLPRTWEELVPAYLPAVPKDPFAPAREPLRMIEADGLVIVYSVGLNGVDDNAADDPRAALRYAGDDWQRRRALPRTAWDQWGGGYLNSRLDLTYPLQIDRPPVSSNSTP
jgi:hypothetical protein